jgi:hypothetical protein
VAVPPLPPTVSRMIIESGIDVVQVLCGSVSDGIPDGLWIVAADENLRLLYVDRVRSPYGGGWGRPGGGGMGGDPLGDLRGDPRGDLRGGTLGDVLRDVDAYIDSHLDAVEECLVDSPSIAYFALAWSSDADLDRDSSWLRDLDERLRERPELATSRLLGIVVFDRTTVFASLPRCDFSLEPDFVALPRAVAIAGPHGPTCPCPPCSADRRSFSDSGGADYHDHDGDYSDESGNDYPDYDYPDYAPADDHPHYDPLSNRWYPEPDRARKRWTTDEEQTVTQSHFVGLTCFDISMLVRRQPRAVASRLNKLGISSRTYVPERDSPVSALQGTASPGSPLRDPANPGPADRYPVTRPDPPPRPSRPAR